MVKKEMDELCTNMLTVGSRAVVPIEFRYDERRCRIVLYVINGSLEVKTCRRHGRHDNYVFCTDADGIPVTVNLQTGELSTEWIPPEGEKMPDYNYDKLMLCEEQATWSVLAAVENSRTRELTDEERARLFGSAEK